MRVRFSVHKYDSDGDIANTGILIFLHFGETRIKVAETLVEFEKVAADIGGMADEIRENYNLKEQS